MPWIDIFGLKLSNDESKYLVPHWPKLYYTKFDINTLIKNKTLGFPIYIPQNHNSQSGSPLNTLQSYPN